MHKKFIMTKKVEFCDADMGGVLYHGNYFKYLDTARLEALSQVGVPIKDLFKSGTALVVVSIESKFMSPAFFDDELKIESEITAIGYTSVTVHQKIFKQATNTETGLSEFKPIHSSTIVLAHVSITEAESAPLPENLIDRLKS